MMGERSARGRPLSLDRRDVLRTIGGAAAAGAFVTTAGTGRSTADSGSYSAVQGEQCVPMTPLSGDRPVEELHDVRIPDRFTGDNGATDPGEKPYYGSVGTQDLQQENTTITFLYDGPDGLSLVVVHGAFGGDGGRGVSWTLRGDVLSDGAWVVKDDFYLDPDTDEPAGSNYDRWDVSGSTHTIDWTWGAAGTDGGAFRPLGDGFELTIDPASNEDAALWDDDYYDGEVTDWQILSFPDGRSSPERTPLALDREATIRSEACDSAVAAEIDVRSRINPKSRGVIPVTLFVDGVDPADVAVGSLRFGPPGVGDDGGGARAAHGGHRQDADGTGGDDLVLHFPTPDAGFEGGETTAKLVGETTDGRRVVGTDGVRVRDPGGDEDERGEGGEGDDDDRSGERDDDGANGEDDRPNEEDDGEDDGGTDDQDEDEEDDAEDERDKPDGEENGRGNGSGRGENGETGNNGRGKGRTGEEG